MGAVEKITIALPPEIAGFVRRAVDAGEYASASDAIGAAVQEWKDRREILGYSLDELRALARDGLESGPTVEAVDVFDHLRRLVRDRIPEGQ